MPMRYSALVLILLSIFLCLRCGAAVEDPPSTLVDEYSRTITIEEIRTHITYLASDELEGRHPGTPGGDKAADYIVRHFKALDLKGGSAESRYQQPFRMARKSPIVCYLESVYGRADNWVDFMEMHSTFEGEREIDLVWAGFGRDSDLESVDVRGKLTAFFMGTPDRERISNDFEKVKIVSAVRRGAAGTLLVVRDDPPFLDYVNKIKPYMQKERHYPETSPDDALRSLRRISISSEAAARLFGQETWKDILKESQRGSLRPEERIIKIRMVSTFETRGNLTGKNVRGYIAGSDQDRDTLILTAHYDHLGRSGKKIYNGAYDNAAGVSALLEIAEAFAAAAENGDRPRRNILFLTPDAEELGGIGSMSYLNDPLFPLDRTLVDINIDGIGREDAEHPDLKNFVHLYLSRNGRADLISAQKRALGLLPLGLRIEDRDEYSGSDHALFEDRLIPAIALSTGHCRDHHLPADTADKLDYHNIREIARLAFAMAWDIAFGESKIERIIIGSDR
jgi:hypothetical protein